LKIQKGLIDARELKGANGQVDLYEDRVVIKKEGLSADLMYGFSSGSI